MVKTKKVRAAGRYGVRYGRKARNKVAAIEGEQRQKQDCISKHAKTGLRFTLKKN